jgi:hypothetical protein
VLANDGFRGSTCQALSLFSDEVVLSSAPRRYLPIEQVVLPLGHDQRMSLLSDMMPESVEVDRELEWMDAGREIQDQQK